MAGCLSFVVSHSSKRGFTLVELLVAMSIIVMIAAVVLINYRGASYSEAVVRNAHVLSSNIRLIQNAALAPANTSPPRAYGIYFDMNSSSGYIAFLDQNGNQAYDPPSSGCRGVGSECLERHIFETRTVLQSLQTVSAAGSRNDTSSLTLLFCPPYATTLLYGVGGRGSDCNGNQATMQGSGVIRLSAGGANISTNIQRNIAITAAGAVEVVTDSQS